MDRMFQTHKIGYRQSLEGLWDFTADGIHTLQMAVPGCWESHPDFCNYRGTAEYSLIICAPANGWYRVVFNGVSHTATVFVDEKEICSHYNAYTAFSALFKLTQGEHTLRVRVDNSFGSHSSLHISNDYYTYGGLIRPVILEALPSAFIDKIFFNSRQDGDEMKCHIEARLTVLESCGELAVKAELDGKTYDLTLNGDTAAIDISVKGVKKWDAENPNLYMLRAVLFEDGKEINDLIERIGFRTSEVKDGKILINGNPIRLLGFNRHEDAPIFGASIPPALMKHDLDLIKSSGGNFVRTSHYPNDPRFLDLCDEMGFYVWEENHARGLRLEEMLLPVFDEQCAQCNKEMAEQHYNHPSIIMWGILNECISQLPEGAKKYKKQLSQLRELDSSRPLTFASNKHLEDLCFEYVDIISFNLYNGWYSDREISQQYQEILDYARQNGGDGKPVIISEFGAGGIYGERNSDRPKWSEERQADILHQNLEFYLGRDEIAGLAVWQFCDCRVCEEGWYFKRPGTKNNKGIFDRYRKPKLAFETVKHFFEMESGHCKSGSCDFLNEENSK